MKNKKNSAHHKIYFQRTSAFLSKSTTLKKDEGIFAELKKEYDEKFNLIKGFKIKLFQIQVKNGKKPDIEPIGRIKFEEAYENKEIEEIKLLIKDLDKKIYLTKRQIENESNEKKIIEERKIAFLEVVKNLGGFGFDDPIEIKGINFAKYYIELFPQDWITKNGSLRSWWKGEYKGNKMRFGISLKSGDIQCYTSTEKEPAQFISAKQLIDYIKETIEKIDNNKI